MLGDDVPVQEGSLSKVDESSPTKIADFNRNGDIDPNVLENDYGIDRIDAKTLNLCVESMTMLVNEDVRAFMELPLAERIEIFRQTSQLLDISFLLYPVLEHRQLNPPPMPLGTGRRYSLRDSPEVESNEANASERQSEYDRNVANGAGSRQASG